MPTGETVQIDEATVRDLDYDGDGTVTFAEIQQGVEGGTISEETAANLAFEAPISVQQPGTMQTPLYTDADLGGQTGGQPQPQQPGGNPATATGALGGSTTIVVLAIAAAAAAYTLS
jgi:hypothetical protein